MRALIAVFLGAAAAAGAQQHGHGRYGNPGDLEGYIARLADPARDAWQRPDEVVRALGLRPGQVACDVGSGPGYFTLRLARAVAPGGHVFAVDVEPQILDALRTRVEEAKATNVVPVLGLGHDPLLPEKACDLVLVVDTYHHFPDRVGYLRRLARSLRPGGRLVNIDYRKEPTPVGPAMDHRIAHADFVAEAKQAGFTVAEEPAFLPYQYFVVLKPPAR